MNADRLDRGGDQPVPPIVLIVDDDADTRELFGTVFKLDGFWVADAADADGALEAAANLQPDLIITDIGLGGPTSGVSLAARIHAAPATADVPILAVSGRPASDLETTADFTDVLLKPVMPEALIAAARRAIAQAEELRARSGRARQRAPELSERARQLLDRAEDLTRTAERFRP